MICGGVLMNDLWWSVDGCMTCGGVLMDDLWWSVNG